jgi:uncharacterized alpha-E superfamily protein
MLSRHADALYWMGRYVERAEDTARMLDVTYHNLLESPPEEEATAWHQLLEVLHLHEAYQDREVTGRAVSHFLVLDEDNPGSIVAAVGRARDNALRVRDRISTDVWEAMNTFYLHLAGLDLAAELERRPYEVFRMVKNRCQLLTGVGGQTMLRDDGYRFILLGQFLERSEMTCRLLAVRYSRLLQEEGPMVFHSWLAVLMSVSAFEAYLKEHDAAFDPAQVLEFLLLSPDFPRSVLYGLRQAERQLDRLVPDDRRRTLERTIGQVRARIEYCDIAAVLEGGLDQFLESLQRDIYEISAAVDLHFFRSGADLQLNAIEST